MKKLARNSFLALLVLVQLASAATLTPEQKEATAFMQKMYSYSAGTFEFGYFQGKYEPDRHCLLMEDFFVPKLIFRAEKNKECDIAGNGQIRYPGVEGIELSESTKPGQMPRPKLSIPVVKGDKARIEATSKYGKTIFFLTNTDKGLRVENALYYERWPPMDEKCWSMFLTPPNAWHKKAEQPVCNK